MSTTPEPVDTDTPDMAGARILNRAFGLDYEDVPDKHDPRL